MPNSSSALAASFMISRSESLPITMATSGLSIFTSNQNPPQRHRDTEKNTCIKANFSVPLCLCGESFLELQSLQVLTKLFPQPVSLERELHGGLQKSELVSG